MARTFSGCIEDSLKRRDAERSHRSSWWQPTSWRRPIIGSGLAFAFLGLLALAGLLTQDGLPSYVTGIDAAEARQPKPADFARKRPFLPVEPTLTPTKTQTPIFRLPQASTSTPVPTPSPATATSAPPTATLAPPTATSTPRSTATRTSTPVPPTATATEAPPTPTSTDTPAPTVVALATAVSTPTAVVSTEHMVFTSYFYWYDAQTGAHLEPQYMRYHPPATPVMDWRNVAWHQKELSDMAAAGVDVVLPVYWGFPGLAEEWSYGGLAYMSQAWRNLDAAGGRPPRIGMFLDTSMLWSADLRTDVGKAYFYGYVRDFFSRIPRNQWALVSGKPIVFLYRTEGIVGVDQTSLDFVYQAFQQEFGVPLYIMRESSWDNPITGWSNTSGPIRDYTRTLRTDGSYQWGASGAGLLTVGDVANVGAGFDNTLVGGNLVVDRQDGNFFASNLYQAGHAGKRLTLLESWNEFHDGSGISETIEFGRRYIDIARIFADQFHALP